MTIEMPSVLAFDRKLENSDALMFSGNWEDRKDETKWDEIKVTERRNRGVMGHKLTDVLLDNPDDLQKEVEKPNPVWGDDAALPHNHDTLKVSFTLRVLGGCFSPSTCNKRSYQDKLKELAESYDFDVLASRYAMNIANGRFLWRNRVCAEKVEIYVNGNSQPFKDHDYSLGNFKTSDDDLEQLKQTIKQGLSGDSFSFVEVNAFVKLGKGQHVWPSQEMIMNIPTGEKSRHLFKLNNCAAMHSQKIGNALRTIDTWYSDDAEPIAIEPYGSVTHRGEAHRTNRNDFYTLSKKWIVDGKELADEEKHFVMAILIRGGVFGESDKG